MLSKRCLVVIVLTLLADACDADQRVPPNTQPAIILDHVEAMTGKSLSVTEGWAFTADSDLWVVAIGVWDRSSDGLMVEYSVAIWDDSGKPLRDAIVKHGKESILVQEFRYTPIFPLRLKRGHSYRVGAFYREPGDDPRVDGGSNNRISEHKNIRWLGHHRTLGDKLTFPGKAASAFTGSFGPNLLIQEGKQPKAIEE
jgi:hypothetical protein